MTDTRLLQRAKQRAVEPLRETVKLNIGDAIEATFRGLEMVPDSYSDGTVLTMLLEEDGHPLRMFVGTVLANELRRVRPQPGERLAIARGEDRQGTKGQYAMYRIEVDRPETDGMDLLDGHQAHDAGLVDADGLSGLIPRRDEQGL